MKIEIRIHSHQKTEKQQDLRNHEGEHHPLNVRNEKKDPDSVASEGCESEDCEPVRRARAGQSGRTNRRGPATTTARVGAR